MLSEIIQGYLPRPHNGGSLVLLSVGVEGYLALDSRIMLEGLSVGNEG
jgi:hypothetical protein